VDDVLIAGKYQEIKNTKLKENIKLRILEV